MLLYPNAKINIGLNIISKLDSGYHLIESCFCPISLYDIIEINNSEENKLSLSGISIDGSINNNIIYKAIKLINSRDKFNIHLHKNIPIGSGLGGGSSDASFILRHLNKFQLCQNELLEKAKKIGSDCPFFIENNPKYVTGIGDIMNNIELDIVNKIIILINPNEKILTQDAYNNICIKKTEYNIKDILENESIDNWKKYIKNAFESYAINKINELKKIKTHLYKLGAKYVSLTGSGSCMYGIFEEKDIIKEDIKYDYYLVRPLIRSDSNR